MPSNALAHQARLYQSYMTHSMTLALAFGDAGVAKKFPFFVPGNSIALITSIEVVVTTAFNSSGTDLVKVGITSGGSELAAAVDVSTVGVKTSTTIATAAATATNPAADLQIYAEYDQSVADAAAGACQVVVNYKLIG